MDIRVEKLHPGNILDHFLIKFNTVVCFHPLGRLKFELLPEILVSSNLKTFNHVPLQFFHHLVGHPLGFNVLMSKFFILLQGPVKFNPFYKLEPRELHFELHKHVASLCVECQVKSHHDVLLIIFYLLVSVRVEQKIEDNVRDLVE